MNKITEKRLFLVIALSFVLVVSLFGINNGILTNGDKNVNAATVTGSSYSVTFNNDASLGGYVNTSGNYAGYTNNTLQVNWGIAGYYDSNSLLTQDNSLTQAGSDNLFLKTYTPNWRLWRSKAVIFSTKTLATDISSIIFRVYIGYDRKVNKDFYINAVDYNGGQADESHALNFPRSKGWNTFTVSNTADIAKLADAEGYFSGFYLTGVNFDTIVTNFWVDDVQIVVKPASVSSYSDNSRSHSQATNINSFNGMTYDAHWYQYGYNWSSVTSASYVATAPISGATTSNIYKLTYAANSLFRTNLTTDVDVSSLSDVQIRIAYLNNTGAYNEVGYGPVNALNITHDILLRSAWKIITINDFTSYQDANGKFSINLAGHFYNSTDFSIYIDYIKYTNNNNISLITFDAQGATTQGTTKQTVWLNQNYLPITVPEKSNLVFDGYYSSIDGGGTKYFNSDGTAAVSGNDFTSDVTLYAYWKEQSYNITYENMEGASFGLYSPTAHTYGTATVISDPTKENYIFEGWQVNGGTASKNLTLGATVYNEDITLTAVWKKINFIFEDLNITTNQGNLVVNIENDLINYKYQFWLKSMVTIDDLDEIDYPNNMAKNNYIWKLMSSYNTSKTRSIPVSGSDLIDGKYNIILRIKDNNDVFINEVYGSFNPEEVNQVIINNITVNDEVSTELYVANKADGYITLNVKANIQEATYSLFNKNEFVTTSETGIFNINVSNLECGPYDLTIKAEYGESSDEKKVRIYLYDDYQSDKIGVIKNFKGETNMDTGYTKFTLQYTYANGNNINLLDAGDFTFTLKTNGILFDSPLLKENIDGVLEAEYTYDFNGKHGIYRVEANISRNIVPAPANDDTLIRYYDKFTRDSELTQDGPSSSVINNTVLIEASGTIENVLAKDIRYAYYREDASGWVMIRDYPKDGTSGNTLNWKPARAGTYNIQVRIKDVNAGSYENIATKTYIITGNTLLGSLSVNIYDLAASTEILGDIKSIEAGKPYKITANYQLGLDEIINLEEDVLYMFTVYNANTGLIYLNTYTVSNNIMFVANKYDDYIITARIIYTTNYGFKDLSKSVELSSKI